MGYDLLAVVISFLNQLWATHTIKEQQWLSETLPMWDVPIDAVRPPSLAEVRPSVGWGGDLSAPPKVDVGMLKVFPGHSLRNQLI